MPHTKELTAKSHQSLNNTAIPDKLLASLSSAASKNAMGQSGHLWHCKASVVRRSDAFWHHPSGREKYKHFLEQPTSLTGAGRDVSFLCDSVTHKNTSLPPLSERCGASTVQNLNGLESLVPEEYHILQNKGIGTLKLYEDAFTVQLQEDDQKLRVFPSLQPSGRLEAIHLMRIMDDMLEKAGVGDQTEELTDFSQMESLLKMVHSEQKIYNIVFHEVIRQVSVECVERGRLLAKLRQRYQSLLQRIPQRLKALHTQAVAQQVFGRRLAEEMCRIQSNIQHLSRELSRVREHDAVVSQQAEVTRQQLTEARAHTNINSIVAQGCHEIYELQRSRLQAALLKMTKERDCWSRTAFCLALKVISAKKLQQVSELHLSERCWFKTAEHCGLYITTKDADTLDVIMALTDQWEEKFTAFIAHLKNIDKEAHEKMAAIQKGIAKWITFCCTTERCVISKCEKSAVADILVDLKQWIKMLTVQSEHYQGEQLLFCQQTVIQLVEQREQWLERSLLLYRTHMHPDDELPTVQSELRDLDSFISEHQKHLDLHFTGESGIYLNILSLIGLLKPMQTMLDAPSEPLKIMSEANLLKLELDLRSCQTLAEELLQEFSDVQAGYQLDQDMIKIYTESEHVLQRLQKFKTNLTRFTQCESHKLMAQISSINKAQIQWMLGLLLLMVPDHTGSHIEEQEHEYDPHVSTQTLEDDSKILIETLTGISKSITRCCKIILEESLHYSLHHDDEGNIMDGCKNLEVKTVPHTADPVVKPDQTAQETGELMMDPVTEESHKAFSDLTTVDFLQQELLMSEQQLQIAEQRALKAEESLQAALEKIQQLENQLEDVAYVGPTGNEEKKITPTPPLSPSTPPALCPPSSVKAATPKKPATESKPASNMKKSMRR
ncbi:axonemal dynein light chain domain-containing protein 1 isoform X2 [Synchiropus splendidus]|uniref:axonemal dynein light chain domain-containing protein 1 isoform X2 n=1 Tax=Synchiropus splendidus TaxID=270530 RepID=UPI00237ECADB|nr:axonemal dynein light chain domain-containing protein 1 isoform X2 [Synchiropus splendidus]